MNKRLIFVLQFIFLTFFAFSQEDVRIAEPSPLDMPPRKALLLYPSAALELQRDVLQIGWVASDKFFMVSPNESFIIDITANTQEEIESDGFITYIETARKTDSGDGNNHDFLTLTDDDKLSIRKLPLNVRYPSKNLYPDSPITCATISPDGAFVATGHENGKINLSMQLFATKALYTTGFYVHSEGIKTLRFNPKSNLLACISREGLIDIWDLHQTEFLFSMNTMEDSPYPVYFTPDSKQIISAESSTEILTRNFDGTISSSLKLENEIKNFQISDEGKFLFELSTNNNIYIYNIYTKKLLGYIPYFSKSEIQDFAFSEDYKTILVAHTNGTIFHLKVSDVLLDPSTPQPKIGGGTYYGGTGSGNGGSGEISSDIGLHNVDMALNIAVPSNPYMVSISPQVSYLYSPLFNPVYYGGSVDISLSIPNPSFPFSYIDLKTGHTIHTPYIIGPKISGVIGYYKKPKSIDIGWYIKFSPTFSLYTFYFPEYGLLDLYPAFAVELQTGINWKQLLIFIGGVYDNRLGASLSGGIGWRIRTGGG